MNESRPPVIVPFLLVIGATLGMAGTFAPTDSLRGLAWGLDGIALVVASAMLTIHHVRLGNDLVAAGFLVFVAGEALVLSGAAMDPLTSAPSFAAGAGLWAASLTLISTPGVMPSWVRGAGFITAFLLALTALQIFSGSALTELSKPLPYFAFPLLVATIFGWAWAHYRIGR